MRVDKPIGIYLLLWPTLWALFLAAEGLPDPALLGIFAAGVVLMRSAGCVINDFADRHVDGYVARTHSRPLANGEIAVSEALTLFTLLISISFALVLLLNWQTIALSVVALMLASLYPFMKRYTHFPQVVLGAAFGWAIPMASMAVNVALPLWVWVLFFANIAWTVAYDTYYAMVDKDDDLRIGVKSTAIAFAPYEFIAIGMLQVLAVSLLAWVFYIKQLNYAAYLGLVVACGLFIKHAWRARARDKQQLFNAFLHNHYVGMSIFIGIVFGLL